MNVQDQDPIDVEQLLRMAGPRDAVPAERLERMRASVRGAWIATATETTQPTDASPHTKRLVLWTLVSVAAAAAMFAIVRTPPAAGVAKRAETPARAAAIQITTGPSERQSVPLSGGGELRVDASSAIAIGENGEIRISKGALYLDSKGAALPAVMTPAGRITDIGTRFEVRIVAGNTRVRVRDGQIRLAQASAVNEVGAAEELLARADASTTRRHVDRFGADWAWVARAAPRFELEGQSLGHFIDWIEKEGAWTVVFESPALERRARSTVLHGSVERMSTTEALDVILPACGLAHRVDLTTGRVIVSPEGR